MAAGEMCLQGTPLEDHTKELGMWVKREDLCCPGGPNFSKTRGVFAHVRSRPEPVIGVLDTSHSQGGWAVARACSLLGKHCVNYYPVRKADLNQARPGTNERAGNWGDILKPQQCASDDLGAGLIPLTAGRSAVLYHTAKRDLARETNNDSYMMPNALKLPESITETAAEVGRTPMPDDIDCVVVSASSATIAAGVHLGFMDSSLPIIVHLGYKRSHDEVRRYIEKTTGWGTGRIRIIDENYAYADSARPGATPPFPCNEFYDLKALRWWVAAGRGQHGDRALFWNIG